MIGPKHLVFLVLTKALDVLTTYYGIASGLAYEINPLWTDINTNPALMLIGLSAVSLLGLLSYVLQPVLSSRAKNEWEKDFCIKAIDWCIYITIFINILMIVNNVIQIIR